MGRLTLTERRFNNSKAVLMHVIIHKFILKVLTVYEFNLFPLSDGIKSGCSVK